MKKLYLSNSQIDTYTDCQRKWYLDKVKKLRPNWKGSPLYFGGALDSAVEHILLKKEGSYQEKFLEEMQKFDVNGVEKKLPEYILDIRFGAGDIDTSIIDTDKVTKYCEELEIEPVEIDEFLEYCKQQRKAKKALEKVEQKIFNYIAFLSLKAKGLLLLAELNKWIDENVAEVHSVQKKIEIRNENGDVFIGYLDFVVTLKNGKKVLIDLKTSSNPSLYYPEDAAEKSRQLGIYSQEEDIPDVAYLVGDKKIRKREPRVRLSFVEGKITEEWLDEVFDEIEQCTGEIKEKLEKGEDAFEKNLDSCFLYSGCEYFNYCKKGCIKGLEYVKKK